MFINKKIQNFFLFDSCSYTTHACHVGFINLKRRAHDFWIMDDKTKKTNVFVSRYMHIPPPPLSCAVVSPTSSHNALLLFWRNHCQRWRIGTLIIDQHVALLALSSAAIVESKREKIQPMLWRRERLRRGNVIIYKYPMDRYENGCAHAGDIPFSFSVLYSDDDR